MNKSHMFILECFGHRDAKSSEGGFLKKWAVVKSGEEVVKSGERMLLTCYLID